MSRKTPRRTLALPLALRSLEGLPLESEESAVAAPSLSQATGRLLVTLRESTTASGVKSAMKRLGGYSSVCHAADFSSGLLDASAAETADVVVLDEIGVLVLSGDAAQQQAVRTAADDRMQIEPEYVKFALGSELCELDPLPASGAEEAAIAHYTLDFLHGYRQGMNDLLDKLTHGNRAALLETSLPATTSYADTAAATWGLLAMRVADSKWSGEGLKIAVLDSGFDLQHPDFAGRSVTHASFIPTKQTDHRIDDRIGHGTHCIGTACGPIAPASGRRYGIAHGCEIFAGKVLAQQFGGASGSDGWILAGLNWAVSNKCEIVSLSLGGPPDGPNYSAAYENAARRALAAGTLIVAAAGNDSQRPGIVKPVATPANCPSIVAVAAVDQSLRVASFSNGERYSSGGAINLSAPGVSVLSSAPLPRGMARMQGTSMATPHVAGVAALVAQGTGKRGVELYQELRRRAQTLGERRDYGNGLARV